MLEIVLATGNKGKVAELSDMLAHLPVKITPQSNYQVPDVPETGTTFVENAIIKARHAAKLTGKPAIADDSGLAVDALGGAPGIYSARYAGNEASDSDNVAKLLDALQNVPEHERNARFICCLVFMRHADDPTPLIYLGEWEGEIAASRSGDGGFGYDPVFYIPEQSCTAAQLSKEVKSQMSHRGKALSMLLDALEIHFG